MANTNTSEGAADKPVEKDGGSSASKPEAGASKPRRHRRTKAEIEAARAAEAEARAAAEAAGEAPKRRRGRPRKADKEAATASVAAPTPVAPAAEPTQKPSGAHGVGDLNRITQEATKASSEFQPMPQQTLSNADAPKADGQGGRSRRKRRHPGDRAAESSQAAAALQAEVAPAPAGEGSRSEGAANGGGNGNANAGANGGNGGGNANNGNANNGGGNANNGNANNGGGNANNGNANNGGGNAGNNFQNRRLNSKERRRQRRQQEQHQNQGQRQAGPSTTREDLAGLKVAELRMRAAELDVEYIGLRKPDLIDAVFTAAARAEGYRDVDGVLEIGNEGYGWVRTGNFTEGDDDAFVSAQMIRSLGLRPGDKVAGTVGPGRANSKYPPVIGITAVNGKEPDPSSLRTRPRFRDLTPVYPNERLVMECGRDSITGRAIDLVSPVGKGQRGLIVSPPKAGKTTVLKKICQSIARNNPEVHLFCLLVDERPEEVTDMQRSIKGEVVASTFDMPAENHTKVAELTIEHAKRLVEMGEDVVVVLDSITRLARAYNLAAPASGRILSGGVDSAALYPPKKFLGAARNIENGGSLTIIASALVDTGSKMDEVIFEEFKGTGNMELKLDRDLADKRIFPAIDPVASGTRNEDLLIDEQLQPLVWGIRRILANMNNVERAANALVKGLKGTDSNTEFLIRSAKKAQQSDYIA